MATRTVYIDRDELWPYFFVRDDAAGLPANHTVEVDEKDLKRFERARRAFFKYQDELKRLEEKMYENARAD